MKTFSIPAAVTIVASCALTPACNDTGTTTPQAAPAPTSVTTALQLRDEMRQLWIDDAIWTRVYVIGSAANSPELDATTTRLLRNETNLANSFRPFLGSAPANQLIPLFQDRTTDMKAVIGAAIVHDAEAYDQAVAAVYANADQIAGVLATANASWSESELQSALRDHLDKTFGEILARAKSDFAKDILSFDLVEEDSLSIADTLSSGIVAGFPGLIVSVAPPNAAADALHLDMRRLWEENDAWTRFYLISDVAGLPDVSSAKQRLLQNQSEIGDVFAAYYGRENGDLLTQMLTGHVAELGDVIAAKAQNDQVASERLKAAWFGNAANIAAIFAEQNPNLRQDDLDALLRLYLQQTSEDAGARIIMNWNGDVADFDASRVTVVQIADTLSSAINAEFPTGATPPM